MLLPIPAANEEEFVVDGPQYSTVDGHKQTLTCQARWEGAILVIERDGPQGPIGKTVDIALLQNQLTVVPQCHISMMHSNS